jgi:lysophospholipid acyltransferase (LPLAT)-like uncharacterized protein
MKLSRRLMQKRWVQKTLGVAAAEYLRLVWMTSRVQMEPADPFRLYGHEQPVILAMWHGQHFLLPFLRRGYRFKVLISRHIDGEINAIAAEWLGVGTVRGSGDHGRRYHIKGGVGAFKSMMDVLAEGTNMALTADVPKVSRVAGLGIIKLASATGRPIFPFALATSRRVELNNWDRSAVNLPFSRAAGVVGDMIRVPADASPEVLEHARSTLEQTLNAATERAYALADRRPAAVRDTASPERLEIERRVSNNGIIAD